MRAHSRRAGCGTLLPLPAQDRLGAGGGEAATGGVPPGQRPARWGRRGSAERCRRQAGQRRAAGRAARSQLRYRGAVAPSQAVRNAANGTLVPPCPASLRAPGRHLLQHILSRGVVGGARVRRPPSFSGTPGAGDGAEAAAGRYRPGGENGPCATGLAGVGGPALPQLSFSARFS